MGNEFVNGNIKKKFNWSPIKSYTSSFTVFIMSILQLN